MMVSTHLLMFLIGLVYPVYLLSTYKKVNRRLKQEEPYRSVYYRHLTFIFWLLTCLILGNSFIEKSIPLNFYPNFNVVGIILTVLILFFIGMQMLTSKISTRKHAEVVFEKTKNIFHYLPKSQQEFIWFNILSVSAGICEEIIFRLFMFSYLQMNTNLATAFILTNIIFAATHIDTSKQNALNAFVLGLLFTSIYFFTDNIWLPILLHISIDVNLGYMGYRTNQRFGQFMQENTKSITH